MTGFVILVGIIYFAFNVALFVQYRRVVRQILVRLDERDLIAREVAEAARLVVQYRYSPSTETAHSGQLRAALREWERVRNG